MDKNKIGRYHTCKACNSYTLIILGKPDMHSYNITHTCCCYHGYAKQLESILTKVSDCNIGLQLS